MDFLIKKNLEYKDGIWCDDRNFSDVITGGLELTESTSFYHNHRSSCILEAVRNWNKSEHFVDVGAGFGYNAMRLIEAGYEVTVFEPKTNRAKICKERGITNVVCAYFSPEQVKEHSVPAVGLFDVIEHIENDDAFLAGIHSLISTKGLIFIAVPAYKRLWSYKDDRAQHYRRYTIKQLKKLLQGEGYRVLYCSYFFSLLVIPMFFLKSLPYIFKKPKAADIRKASDKAKKEHMHGWRSAVLTRLFHFEKFLISKGKRVPFGACCLIVAEKA